MGIFEDLEAEDERLEAILTGLDDEAWQSPSLAPGWCVTDVVLHLALTDELVVSTLATPSEERRPQGGESVDDAVARNVREQQADAKDVFARWKAAWRAAVVALREADPNHRHRWAAWPLKPATLATTRLAEHWAHGLDVTQPFGIALADTDRLHHIAWLGHRTLPYAFGLEGMEAPTVRCELTGPSGDRWTFGPEDAPTYVTGPAGDFCRVGARRVAPENTDLVAEGPSAADVLRLLRNYAA